MLNRYFHAYQQIARDDLADPFEKSRWRRLIPFRRFIGDTSGKRILEVGCGRGELLTTLDGDKTGLDIAKPYLETCKGNYGRVQALVEHLPFATGTFDVAIADCVLEHVLDLEQCLAEIQRILHSNGCLYVVVPYKEDLSVYRNLNTYYGLRLHRRRFNSLKFHGFTAINTKYVVPQSLGWLSRLLVKLVRRATVYNRLILLLDRIRLLWNKPVYAMLKLSQSPIVM